MYCGNCGSEVAEGNNFCGACGYNLKVFAEEQAKKQEEARLAQEQASGQKAMMVLTTDKVAGVFKRKLCYLVFFSDKVVLAHMSNSRLKEVSKRLAKESNYNDKKWTEKLAYSLTFYEEIKKFYDTMTPEEVLAEDVDNMAIYYVAVLSAKFIPKLSYYKEDDPHSKFGELIIKSNHGKFKFTHTYEDSDDVIRNQLSSFFIGKM